MPALYWGAWNWMQYCTWTVTNPEYKRWVNSFKFWNPSGCALPTTVWSRVAFTAAVGCCWCFVVPWDSKILFCKATPRSVNAPPVIVARTYLLLGEGLYICCCCYCSIELEDVKYLESTSLPRSQCKKKPKQRKNPHSCSLTKSTVCFKKKTKAFTSLI